MNIEEAFKKLVEYSTSHKESSRNGVMSILENYPYDQLFKYASGFKPYYGVLDVVCQGSLSKRDRVELCGKVCALHNQYNIPLETFNRYEETPLHHAVRNLQPEIVEIILRYGHNHLILGGEDKHTPLCGLVELFDISPIHHEKCLRIIDIFVKHDPDILLHPNACGCDLGGTFGLAYSLR